MSISTQLGRNRSTRALWDPNYVDESWINSIIKLIPRMQDWVSTYYPGLQTGITEYNWGAEGHINGATAQADIFGIFGREGLDFATRWTTPSSSSPTFKAMQMYRNYDGNKSTFGDTSVSVAGPDPDDVACFAALRSSDGALTIMAINKQIGTDVPTSISLQNFPASGDAEVWQLTSANTITQLSDATVDAGNTISNTLPAQSITLFVVPGEVSLVLRDAQMNLGGTFEFWLDGSAGQQVAIQASADLKTWLSVQTNTLSSNSVQVTLPVTQDYQHFRAQLLP